jgi:hypothetical protein
MVGVNALFPGKAASTSAVTGIIPGREVNVKADKEGLLSDGNSSAANYLADRGKIIFDTIAFHCHGKKGEGGMGPAIMEPKSDLAKYKTAKERNSRPKPITRKIREFHC